MTLKPIRKRNNNNKIQVIFRSEKAMSNVKLMIIIIEGNVSPRAMLGGVPVPTA
jgi:hypothetical protein